ncbi:heme NO-binding domain-containing protein [Shimia sp. MMG029]|uniref:heme NO-binding domain-containing protein n=1 Tax=Shimia sp. MMG029 TaxID=3021978 RepID=UPI0022FE1F64|nr:heme NO-binding domain-containing protein [Shimia sp. MMG029]MDA5558858.1 heme NO-binding domain-containing protein [Shimia sp. MMG029]
MKGIVFVELIRMAEAVLGEEVVDEILDEAVLETDGAFSAVGNYPCKELLTIVEAVGARTGVPVEALHVQFGHWMFDRFVDGYPAFFEGKTDGFHMLESIEDEVHVEVRKLYPEVELPRFDTERLPDGRFKMVYDSERPLHHFCKGLIESCMAHFNQAVHLDMRDYTANGRYTAEFLIQKAA